MDSEHQDHIRTVKVAILGDRKTGKTYLARKLTGRPVGQETETTDITPYTSEGSQFVYVDYPTFSNDSIIEIGAQGHYDILVFLFKECESFTKLYEFLVAVREVIDECKNKQVRYYWQHLKKVIFIYTDFQSPLPVQLDQLFPILEEEVASFCKEASISTFAINKTAEHYDELKSIIEEEIVFFEFNDKEQQIQEKEQKVENMDEMLELREVAISGEEPSQKQQQIAHPVHEEELEAQNLRDSKINEDKKSEVYKKIHDSFFNSSSIIGQENEDVPQKYQEVQLTASNNILEEFRHPNPNDHEQEAALDKQIKEYIEEKIHKMEEEEVDISEGDLPSKYSMANQTSAFLDQSIRHTKEENKHQQERKQKSEIQEEIPEEEDLRVSRSAQLLQRINKQQRQRKQAELYRQVVKEQKQLESEQKQAKEELQQQDEQKPLITQQEVKEELAKEIEQVEQALQHVQEKEKQLEERVIETDTQLQNQDKKERQIQQEEKEELKQQQLELKKAPESEPSKPEEQQILIRKPVSGIEPIKKGRTEQLPPEESKCVCLMM